MRWTPELREAVANVWDDIERKATEDATQSFGDLLDLIGLECDTECFKTHTH